MNALEPAGRFAAPLADLSWLLFAVCTGVLVVVCVMLLMAFAGGERLRRFVAHKRAVIIGGFAFPVVVLTGLLVYSLVLTTRVSEPAAADDLRIRVSGEMWWWRVTYLDDNGQPLFETANEIRVPVGRTIALELESADVIHAFWVPQLGPKRDMIPGRTNLLRLEADRPGEFRGQCAEFCGGAHALMAKLVIAETAADYEIWAARQAEAQVIAETDLGWMVFAASGCGACHSVRGTPANGRIGPDLTHLGSRRTLAAAILANDSVTRRKFLEAPDQLKPGVRMPAYAQLPVQDLDALNAWLGALQ